MPQILADLQAAVAANTAATQAVLAVVTRLASGSVDPAALTSLTDALKASNDALNAAVAANTPAP